MFNLMSLLAAAALVSLFSVQSYAQIDGKIELDNNLSSNEITPPARRGFKKFVRISSPPPETVRHESGTVLVLECEIVGNPTPVAGWTKNGIPITDFEEEVNEIYSHTYMRFARMTSKLVVTSPSNGDVYTCLASNGLMEATASTTVIVEGDQSDLLAKLMPTKPIITATYEEIFQLQGTSLTLPCRVYSPTKSQIYWFDKSDNVIYGNGRMRVLPSGDLLIKPLMWSDMGKYKCTAKNAFGKDVTETYLYPVRA